MGEDINETSLVRVSDVVAPRFRHIFKHENFNHMQSAIIEQALNTDSNMVVAAPTGSGKTVIHELAVVRLLQQDIRQPKTVFVAPNKALCQQRMREWDEKFTSLGQTVLEVTGDIDLKQCLRLIAMANIIITTPEKWDSLTRVWKDHIFLLGSINLLLIDEVHHLGEDRGATLEALVVRMRMLSSVYLEKLQKGGKTGGSSMRVIALSATLPNLADIGEWLNCSHDSIHYFDESFRPVPLRVHTLSMGSMNNPFLFDKSLDERVGPLILSYSEGKQVLVFCASKKSTETLCTTLTQRIQIPREALNKARTYRDLISTAHNDHLRELLSRGVAFHHSGLPADDRALVEQLFLSGAVHILCCTSTLAHGVNLPAHLVVIKGTSSWRGGSRGYERTSKADIIQMLGRAGRQGMDNQGVAVIMTSREDQDFYADVSLSAEVVESKLQNNLVEAICAEVTQTVITSIADCINWMKSTFFYVRVRKNPTKYGFEQFTDAVQLDALLCNLCTAAIGDLAGAGIVRFDEASKSISALPEALIMTRSMIKFQTMELLVKVPAAASIVQVLSELCKSTELDKPVRRMEKRLLNELMKSVRFPLKARVQEPHQKSYVLVQAAVARVEIKDFSLRVEQAEIVECALRVLSALRELSVHRELGALLESTVLLERALRKRMWETNYGSVFQQCPGLSTATSNSLTLRGVRNLGDVEGCTLNRVQDLTGGTQPESRVIAMFAKMLKAGSRDVFAAMEYQQLVIQIRPTYTPGSLGDSSTGSTADYPIDSAFPAYQLIAYDVTTAKALCIRNVERGAKQVEFRVPAAQVRTIGDVKCCLLSNYVGIDSYQLPTIQPQGAVAATSASAGSSARVERQQEDSPAKATQHVPKSATKAPKAPKAVHAKTVVDNSVYLPSANTRSVGGAIAAPSPLKSAQPQPTSGSLHAYFPSTQSPVDKSTARSSAPPQQRPQYQAAQPTVAVAAVSQSTNLGRPAAATNSLSSYDHNLQPNYHAPKRVSGVEGDVGVSAEEAETARGEGYYYDQFDFEFADFSVPAKVSPWKSTSTAENSFRETQRTAYTPVVKKEKKSPVRSPPPEQFGGGGGGGDVAIVRRKAAELELDRLPVQRLRSNCARRNDPPYYSQQQQQQAMPPYPAVYAQAIPKKQSVPSYTQHPPFAINMAFPDAWPEHWDSMVPAVVSVPPPPPQYIQPATSSRKRFFDESDDVIPLSQEFEGFGGVVEKLHPAQAPWKAQQQQWSQVPPVAPVQFPVGPATGAWASSSYPSSDQRSSTSMVAAQCSPQKENLVPQYAYTEGPQAPLLQGLPSTPRNRYAERSMPSALSSKITPMSSKSTLPSRCSLPALKKVQKNPPDQQDEFESIFF